MEQHKETDSVRRHASWLARLMGLTMSLMLTGAGPALAQTYASGSTGADGALAPTANTTLPLPPDGILNFTTVNIPAGVTVTFQRNAANTPVTLLATADVLVFGTIDVTGAFGVGAPNVALGGPGGFSGGAGGSPPGGGAGPGGGAPSGFGVRNGNYGAPTTFVSLLPLFGGSGGAAGSSVPLAVSAAGGAAGLW